MLRILFIHGFASSGVYKTASTLRTLLRPCELLSPDFPADPLEVQSLLSSLSTPIVPDLVVGLSWGGFWARQIKGVRKILINPSFHSSLLLRKMIGPVDYLSPRADGARSFLVTESLCKAYEELEAVQFENLTDEERALTDALFATGDELVHCGPEFESHYPGKAHYYPGGHLPTFPEIKKYLVPLVKR